MTGTEPEDHQVEVGSDAVAGLASLLPVGAFATDGAGRCTYVSDRWCQLSGLDANRALGRGWIAAVHADDRAAVGRAWQRFVAGEGPFTTEFRFVGDDGQGRWVRALARATRDDAGHLTRCVGTVTEITDQRAALARLAQLTERLSDMVVVIDRDGIIRWANGATKRVLGYERATKYGTPIFDLVHPDDLPRTVDGLARFTRDEHTQTGINLRVRCADDSWRRRRGGVVELPRRAVAARHRARRPRPDRPSRAPTSSSRAGAQLHRRVPALTSRAGCRGSQRTVGASERGPRRDDRPRPG